VNDVKYSEHAHRIANDSQRGAFVTAYGLVHCSVYDTIQCPAIPYKSIARYQ